MRRRRHGFCNDLFSVVETASHSNRYAASGEPHRAILRAQAAGRGARVGESGAGQNRAESGTHWGREGASVPHSQPPRATPTDTPPYSRVRRVGARFSLSLSHSGKLGNWNPDAFHGVAARQNFRFPEFQIFHPQPRPTFRPFSSWPRSV
jgi:hypothetical protein